MSNTNGEWLDEQEKAPAPVASAAPVTPVAPAAPQAAPTGYADYLSGLRPTDSVAKDYGSFLEQLQKNRKAAETPQGAMTYTDYLVYMGQDPVGDYQAKVRQAELEYRKGLATYGQQAEKMAQAGMVGAGYGEYLAGQAYAAKQGALNNARVASKAAQEQSVVGYAQYLEQLKAQQEAQKTATVGVDGINVDPTELANATAAVSSATSDGKTTVDAAIAGLTGVYSKEVLDQVRTNMTGANAKQMEGVVASATGVQDYGTLFAGQKGLVGEDTYNAQVAAGQAKNYEFIEKAMNNGDFSGLSAYAAANALDISASSTEQLNAVVEHMANRGVITNEQRQQYYTDDALNAIRDPNEKMTSKEAVNEVEHINSLLTSGKINEEGRKQVMQALAQRVHDELGGVQMNGIKWNVADVNREGKITAYKTTVWYHQGGDKGEKSIQLTINPDEPVTGTFYPVPGYTDGKSSIGMVNGKLAIQKDGKAYYASYFNGYGNAGFVAVALTNVTAWN